MNNAGQLLNGVGQGRCKCCKPWPKAEDDNTNCAVSSRGCLNAPSLLETFPAAPKKVFKKTYIDHSAWWPNRARSLSVNCEIKIEIVRDQMDILTRITPCYRKEEWHEQCEYYHYGIRSGKKLKFRDQSLFIARRGVVGDLFWGGITWLLGEQKGGSVVIEIPKGGSLETLEGFRGGTTQICLENGDDISTGIPNSVGLLHSRF